MSSNPNRQGTWVFVVGPSGAGKDTVIDHAREALKGDDQIYFARRVVTRPQNEFEDHDTLSVVEFEKQQRGGEFVLWWQAHELHYGIRQEWQDHVARGGTVVCNISRALLPDIEQRVKGRTSIVLVTAPPDVLALRIAARGRDSAQGSRTARALDRQVREASDLIIENTGTPEQAGEAFVCFLEDLQNKT
ncbi:MAG: phosphonate metabolism protein/1,5-bisphosphokinase (PRPP-forming) PhnN [Pseudomonadota bacterium]